MGGGQTHAVPPGNVGDTLVEQDTETSTKAINIEESEGTSGEQLKQTFYFALEGTKTRGSQIEYGTNVDLVFNYDIPPSSSVANIEGGELEKSRLSDGELGIAVIPKGLFFRNEEETDWYKVAEFRNGQILEELRFEFCAGSFLFSDDKENYGFNITIDVRGLVVYAFFLEVILVNDIDQKIQDKFCKPISLDLDKVNLRVKNFESRIRMEE